MNHREPTRTPPRVRPSSRMLALLLLPVLMPESAVGTPRPRPSAGLPVRVEPEAPVPYLRHVGAVPLRFQLAPPPPAPWPVSLTPIDTPTETRADVSLETPPTATQASVQETTSVGATELARADGDVDQGSTSTGETRPLPIETRPQQTPSPILVDELRTTVRPEDFLPFFLLPGTKAGEAGTALIVPVPRQAAPSAPMPPSSATYNRLP